MRLSIAGKAPGEASVSNELPIEFEAGVRFDPDARVSVMSALS
jgi:hypothetical protein